MTVPGGTGVTIAIPYTSSSNAAAAVELLQGVYYASPLLLHIADAGSASSNAIPGDVNELVDTVPGQQPVPPGYQYLISDYLSNPNNPYPNNSFIGNGNFNGAVIDAQENYLNYTAGTGSVTIVAGGGLNFYTMASGGGGGTLLLDGTDTQTADLASGAWSVQTGTGNGIITLGSGKDTVVALGYDNIVAGSGGGSITLSHGADSVVAGQGTLSVTDDGGGDTVRGGAGLLDIYAQGNGLQAVGGGGEVTFVDITGHNHLTAGGGGAVAFGSGVGSYYQTGGSYFFLTSGGGNDTISAPYGTVAPIVFGSPNGRVEIYAQAAGSFVVAGAGSETINAGSSSTGVVFFSGTGNADMVGGGGANFFCASTGDSTMSGGNGIGNVYEFIDGFAGGINQITNFTPYDSLYLSGYGSNASEAIVSEVVNDGVLDMTLSDGTRINFQNISSASQLDGKIHFL